MVDIFTALLGLLGLTAGAGGNGGGATSGPRRRTMRDNGATPAVATPAPAAAPPQYRFHSDTLRFPTPLSAGMAVRILLLAAGRAVQDDGLGGKGKTPQDAREALGRDLCAYLDLCLATDTHLPSQSVATERTDDARYRARMRQAMLSDLSLWERALLRRKRERDEALEADLRFVPPPLYLPPAVLDAIAARNAAREAERQAARGGRAASGGPPPPPAGPKR